MNRGIFGFPKLPPAIKPSWVSQMTPPLAPNPGDRWYNPALGRELVWIMLLPLGVNGGVWAPLVQAPLSAAPTPPQGRLTLQTGMPVMTTSFSGQTTLYYTPYGGQFCPLWNGSSWVMTDLGGELSAVTTDVTKSPAGIGAAKVNDWFIWSDSGVPRLGHGPDWTNDTTRSAGAALVLWKGIWLNNANITNGPASGSGTYVGTTRSNGGGQLDWVFGSIASGGTAGFFYLWNMYNRRSVGTMVGDSTASWTLLTGNIRAANNSSAMRVSFVQGIQEDEIFADYADSCQANNGGHAICGVGFDTTTAFSMGRSGFMNSSANVAPAFGGCSTTLFGAHYVNAMEAVQSGTGGTSGTFYGNASESTDVQNGLYYRGMH